MAADMRIYARGVCACAQDNEMQLEYKDIIFVMEDVDAASSVVHRRDLEEPRAPVVQKTTFELTRDDGFGTVTEKVTREMSDSGEVDMNTPVPSNPQADRQASEGLEQLMRSTKGASASEIGPKSEGQILKDAIASAMAQEDALTLAGLLNVLDGVVDTPERMLIMTSNHPEKLDRALIRPGRIDKQIYLGYLLPGPAAQMVEHYFRREVLCAAEKKRLAAAVEHLKFTPAMMEQLCAEHSSVDSMLEALEAKLMPPPMAMLVPSKCR